MAQRAISYGYKESNMTEVTQHIVQAHQYPEKSRSLVDKSIPRTMFMHLETRARFKRGELADPIRGTETRILLMPGNKCSRNWHRRTRQAELSYAGIEGDYNTVLVGYPEFRLLQMPRHHIFLMYQQTWVRLGSQGPNSLIGSSGGTVRILWQLALGLMVRKLFLKKL